LGFREVRIVTNGTRLLIGNSLAVMSPRVRFSVSLHSPIAPDMTALTGNDQTHRKVVAFIDHLRVRVNYINCVITPYNHDVSGLWRLGEIAQGIPLCFKQLDYNFPHGCGAFPVRSYRSALNWAIRIMHETWPTQPIDIRFFPYCAIDHDLIDSGVVRMCSAITNSYDPCDWNPVVSSRTPLRQYLRFIFGTAKMREKVTLEQAAIISQRECRRIVTCQVCKYRARCDGTQVGYLKAIGGHELKAVPE
jgi:hypothetical protein